MAEEGEVYSVEVFCCFAGEDGVVCVGTEDGGYAVGEILTATGSSLVVVCARSIGRGE